MKTQALSVKNKLKKKMVAEATTQNVYFGGLSNNEPA